MQFNARGGISVLELLVYIPALILAAFICARHGFSRSSGWIFTLILCLVRVIGACCQLATYHDASTNLIETTLILNSVGISPLLLATLGLLSRCVDSIRDPSFLTAIHFRLIQLLITVGLILSIVGGTSSISANGTYTPQTSSKAGVALYAVSFVALTLISLVTITQLSRADSGEKRLLLAVLLAIPFILVRITYSAISVFGHHHDFNLLTGSVTIYAIMAVLTEFIVIAIYLTVGLTTQALPATRQGPIQTRPWKGNPNGPQRGRLQGLDGRNLGSKGPIHGLVGIALDAARSRNEPRDVENVR